MTCSKCAGAFKLPMSGAAGTLAEWSSDAARLFALTIATGMEMGAEAPTTRAAPLPLGTPLVLRALIFPSFS